jgi:hypothetical protein
MLAEAEVTPTGTVRPGRWTSMATARVSALEHRALAPSRGRQQRGQHLGSPQGLAGSADVAVVEVVGGAALMTVDREVGPTSVLGAADDLVRRDDAGVQCRSARRGTSSGRAAIGR